MPGSELDRKEDQLLGRHFRRADLKTIPVGSQGEQECCRSFEGSPRSSKRTSQRWSWPGTNSGPPSQFVQRGFLEAYREKLPGRRVCGSLGNSQRTG